MQHTHTHCFFLYFSGSSNFDYYVSGVQIHGGGNTFQKCMTLAAVDDDLPEEMEFFRVTISSADEFVDIAQRSSVRVYVTDNGML